MKKKSEMRNLVVALGLSGMVLASLIATELNENRYFEKPDNLLYHPIKGQFIEREKTLKEKYKKHKKKGAHRPFHTFNEQ